MTRGAHVERLVSLSVLAGLLALGVYNAVPRATPALPLDADAVSAIVPPESCVPLDCVRTPSAPDARSLLRLPEDPTFHADRLVGVAGVSENVPFWDGTVVLDPRRAAARSGIVREGPGEAAAEASR